MSADGVWVAYYNDYGVHVDAIFSDELEAYRWNQDNGAWRSIAFLRFGVEILEGLSSERPPLS
jgi:hypothetical protein